MSQSQYDISKLPRASVARPLDELALLQGNQMVRVPLQVAVQGAGPEVVAADTSVAYTFIRTDAGGYNRLNNGAAITATIPPNSSVPFPLNTVLTLEQTGAGQVTLTAGAGVTINSAGGLLATSAQFSVISAIQTALNVWTAFGDRA